MYDRSSTLSRVNEARLDLFARKQRPYDAIPPTQGALLQCAKRACYAAGHVTAKQQLLCQTNRVQGIGIGVGMATNGKFAGVLCLQLQPTVRNLQSVGA